MEQELLTLPEHLSSPPLFNGVHVTIFLDWCVVSCRSLSFLDSWLLNTCFGIIKRFLRIIITSFWNCKSNKQYQHWKTEFWDFCFGHCVVCFYLIYGFWLLIWYLQTLLNHNTKYGWVWYIKILRHSLTVRQSNYIFYGHLFLEESCYAINIILFTGCDGLNPLFR